MLQYFWKAKKYAYHLYQENMNRTRLKILYQNEGFSLVCWIELLRTEFCRENFIQARAGAPCWDALTLALGSVGNCTDLEQFPLKGEKRMTDYREWPKSGPLPTTSLSQWKYYVSSCFQIYFSGVWTRYTQYRVRCAQCENCRSYCRFSTAAWELPAVKPRTVPHFPSVEMLTLTRQAIMDTSMISLPTEKEGVR